MSWVRQIPGKELQWLCQIYRESTTYNDMIKGRFTVSTDYSNNMMFLQMDNIRTEDTATYYCARYTVIGNILCV
ncbi:unnamed protein product [Staurois parvus]|uniref:Immunoglobulin V-set domain-containing protein n=1 Tax=Staurois parvus TaxID=386267 RepID=A0ABN9FJP4_9NEOB|nr:unnamed protein product [Staurois parvus]